ncbi:hypothetical protein [Mesorhizobium sp. J8]|uniref:hypothetical protein n=1 Tax=Mesorhizobium sp. J8 TaxID=2777475 RepID=UPI0019151796|nr:hypothetical protein [Mesorhizobium sp. J8]BCM21030.1 hypothetical protein MJ8_48210 [Mesorhizobium sp. J8]
MCGEAGDDKKGLVDLLVRRLVEETGISDDQARELIEMIGTDWASLLREARFLKRRH